jgi:carbonic anhydrase
MQRLAKGLHHFQNQIFSSHKELFERLEKHGQAPETLFITCSDSRIDPNLVTQAGPGDLFILRNVGNLVPRFDPGDSTAAGIEFAVAALKVKDIVICGHSNCGAMQALVDPATLRGLPAMQAWMSRASGTKRLVQENYADLEGEARLTATVEENVLVQLENLREHPSVAAAIEAGALALHGWVYKIQTGEVFAYDALQAQFMALSNEGVAPLDEAHRTRDLGI